MEKVIVVDIQPTYRMNFSYMMPKLNEYLNGKDVLFTFNESVDCTEDVEDYMLAYGIDINKFTIIRKSYGFFVDGWTMV